MAASEPAPRAARPLDGLPVTIFQARDHHAGIETPERELAAGLAQFFPQA